MLSENEEIIRVAKNKSLSNAPLLEKEKKASENIFDKNAEPMTTRKMFSIFLKIAIPAILT